MGLIPVHFKCPRYRIGLIGNRNDIIFNFPLKQIHLALINFSIFLFITFSGSTLMQIHLERRNPLCSLLEGQFQYPCSNHIIRCNHLLCYSLSCLCFWRLACFNFLCFYDVTCCFIPTTSTHRKTQRKRQKHENCFLHFLSSIRFSFSRWHKSHGLTFRPNSKYASSSVSKYLI